MWTSMETRKIAAPAWVVTPNRPAQNQSPRYIHYPQLRTSRHATYTILSSEPVATLHTLSPAPIDLAPFNGNLFQLFYSQYPLPDARLLFSFLCLTQYLSSSLLFAFGLYILSISSAIFLHNSVFFARLSSLICSAFQTKCL